MKVEWSLASLINLINFQSHSERDDESSPCSFHHSSRIFINIFEVEFVGDCISFHFCKATMLLDSVYRFYRPDTSLIHDVVCVTMLLVKVLFRELTRRKKKRDSCCQPVCYLSCFALVRMNLASSTCVIRYIALVNESTLTAEPIGFRNRYKVAAKKTSGHWQKKTFMENIWIKKPWQASSFRKQLQSRRGFNSKIQTKIINCTTKFIIFLIEYIFLI